MFNFLFRIGIKANMKTVKFSVGLKTHVLSALAVSLFYIKEFQIFARDTEFLLVFYFISWQYKTVGMQHWYNCNRWLCLLAGLLRSGNMSMRKLKFSICLSFSGDVWTWAFLLAMILSSFPQEIQCFCLLHPCPCMLLKQKKREWEMTLLLGISVPCGDISAAGLFFDNILGKGSGTGIPAETQANRKLISGNFLSSKFFIC